MFETNTTCALVSPSRVSAEDHMYVVLNRFLLSHQSLDFRRVPEFFKLFYGFDLEVTDHSLSTGLFPSLISDLNLDYICSNKPPTFNLVQSFCFYLFNFFLSLT